MVFHLMRANDVSRQDIICVGDIVDSSTNLPSWANLVEILKADDDLGLAFKENQGDTNTLSKSRYRKKRKNSAISDPDWSQTKSQARDYCTQTCLLGLTQGDILDRSCPNVLLHRIGGDNTRHAINIEEFGRLVRQLGQNMDQGCEPLRKQGARGALFKMTLASYGYIFVGDGTMPVFVRDLKHEGRIYQKLERVQGVSVPVYLGNIYLIHRYFYDMGVRIVHMLLMSWAGEVAEDGDTADLKGEVQRSVQDLCNEWVIHSDVRQPNILWNLERRRAMLVDSERAEVLDDKKRQVLSHISVNLDGSKRGRHLTPL